MEAPAPGRARGQVFVRVNQVLVRLWALPSQSLTGRYGVPAMAMVFRGDCCVLSKSDSAMSRIVSRLSARSAIGGPTDH